jgi:predicted SAM-dependent methyltransferase
VSIALNLGCGPDYRPGWFNVDADKAVKADEHCDVTNYTRLDWVLAGKMVDAIYMKHVLEHLAIADVPPHLAWCFKTLAPGGTLTIDGPNLRTMCAHLASKPAWTWEDVRMIYGGQGTVYDFHQAGWSPEFLAGLLHQAGFVGIVLQDADLCFIMQGEKPA